MLNRSVNELLGRDVKHGSDSILTTILNSTVVLLMLLAGPVSGQEGPCAGKVRNYPIEGVGEPSILAANGNRLVASDGQTVSSWDISDPESPEFLGRWTLWDETFLSLYPMVVDERGFAFVGYGDVWSLYRQFGVRVWDARGTGPPQPIAVMGNWVDFIVDEGLLIGLLGESLRIIDVSDPFNPRPVCQECAGLELGNGPPSAGDEYLRIAKVGHYAVVLDFDTVSVVDYSNPYEAAVIASVQTNGFFGLDTVLYGSERIAVMSSYTGPEVLIMDDPSNPTIHSVDIGIETSNWGGFDDDVLIQQAEYGSRVRRFDFSNPTEPVELESIGVEDWPDSGAIANEHLYVGTSSGIWVYDLTGVPAEVGAGLPDHFINRIGIDDGIGLATGGPTLYTFDLDHPDGPTELARLDLDWWPQFPVVDGPLGAAFSYGEGVVLIDLALPHEPNMLSILPTTGEFVTDLELAGGVLKIASRNDLDVGLVEVWDVSSPGSAHRTSTVEVDEPVWTLETVGTRVFLGLDESLAEVDLSDPLNPVVRSELALRDLHGKLTGIAAVEGRLLVSADYGIAEVDISTPGEPVQRELGYHEIYADWLTSYGDIVVGGQSGSFMWIMKLTEDDDRVQVLEVVAPMGWNWGGGIVDQELYLAKGDRLSTLDLSCTLPDADYSFYRMGTMVQFIDRTTYDDWGGDRSWRWTSSHDAQIHRPHWRSPLIDFGMPGNYDVTLEVTTEAGVSTVTKTIEVPLQPGLSGMTRQSGGRLGP